MIRRIGTLGHGADVTSKGLEVARSSSRQVWLTGMGRSGGNSGQRPGGRAGPIRSAFDLELGIRTRGERGEALLLPLPSPSQGGWVALLVFTLPRTDSLGNAGSWAAPLQVWLCVSWEFAVCNTHPEHLPVGSEKGWAGQASWSCVFPCPPKSWLRDLGTRLAFPEPQCPRL